MDTNIYYSTSLKPRDGTTWSHVGLPITTLPYIALNSLCVSQFGRPSDQLPLFSQVMTPPGPYPLLHLTVIVVLNMYCPSSNLSVEYCTAPFATLLHRFSQDTTEKDEREGREEEEDSRGENVRSNY